MLRTAVALVLLLGTAASTHAAGEDGMAKAQEAAAALATGNTEQSVTLFSEALADTGLANDRRAGILNDRAVAYGRLSQPKLAIDDFNRAIQLYPENPVVYNNRGNTLLALGLTREALRDFDRAILLAPGYAAALNNRAGAYLKLGQNADALRDYTRAIELSPQSAPPLGGRGRALLADQRPHAALRDFTRALNIDSRFSPAFRARGEAQLAVERYDEAIEDLSRAIAFEPTSADLVQLRGRAYLAAGNPASAIKDFTRAIELAPRRPGLYEQRAFAYARAEAFEEADADLVKALELNPRSAIAFAYRAWLYRLTSQPEVGQREIEKALRIEPNRAEVVWAKAELAEAFGRIEEAVTGYRTALALAPDLGAAATGLERLGVPVASSNEVEIQGAGVDPWRIVKRGSRYHAISSTIGKVQVALETVGGGVPKLLEWELKKAPYAGIGLLRFSAGQVPGPGGTEELEHVAIIDANAKSIIGIQPHRLGEKVARWTWEDGRVQIASIDGVTDEFVLRAPPKPVAAPTAAPTAATANPDRRIASQPSSKGTPAWAPWADGAGYDSGAGNRNSRQSAPPQQKKPKSLFDYILGN